MEGRESASCQSAQTVAYHTPSSSATTCGHRPCVTLSPMRRQLGTVAFAGSGTPGLQHSASAPLPAAAHPQPPVVPGAQDALTHAVHSDGVRSWQHSAHTVQPAAVAHTASCGWRQQLKPAGHAVGGNCDAFTGHCVAPEGASTATAIAVANQQRKKILIFSGILVYLPSLPSGPLTRSTLVASQLTIVNCKRRFNSQRPGLSVRTLCL
jgi:hypothetical protein